MQAKIEKATSELKCLKNTLHSLKKRNENIRDYH